MLTGRDQITARFMRRDNFHFWGQFKLTVSGNHKPRLNALDEAMRRRFNLAPFLNKPKNPDRTLEERLKPEWPGILRWMIDGCIKWQREGLNPPPAVQAATDAYFEAENYFGRWLEECCQLVPYLEARPGRLFQSFQDWCGRNGEVVSDNRKLRGMLEGTPGLKYVQSFGKQVVRGIGLNPPTTERDRYGDDI